MFFVPAELYKNQFIGIFFLWGIHFIYFEILESFTVVISVEGVVALLSCVLYAYFGICASVITDVHPFIRWSAW